MVWILFWVALSAQAGNEHEHLQYLPRWGDIRMATGEEILRMDASRILPESYPQTIVSRFGPNVMDEEEYRTLRSSLKFGDFCRKIQTKTQAHSVEEIMRGFFEWMPSHVDPKGSYASAGGVRNRFFRLNPQTILPSLARALER